MSDRESSNGRTTGFGPVNGGSNPSSRATYDPNKWKAYRKRSARPSKSSSIVAIDGEGISDPDGTHRYTLLMASNGTHIESHDLSTIQCFNFLLALPSNSLIVGFSVNYDINMMLRDVSEDHLRKLWTDGYTQWGPYKIEWIPTKKFRISVYGTKRSVTVWDVFGFFQCSFVQALKQWKIGDDITVDRIIKMKSLRGEFDEEHTDQIKHYCADEVNLLVELVKKLVLQCERVDIRLKSYHGAGSIAAALLSKHNIKEYLIDPPKEIFDAALSAYYGGRFEIAICGFYNRPIYMYDIRSAYPAEIADLPCLAHGSWSPYRGNHISDTTLCDVQWSVPFGTIWGPLPWRYQDGRILYPIQGRGWYWGKEVRAARNLYPGKIKVIKAYKFKSTCNHKPFKWVPELYDLRNKLKSEGDFGQMVLKLGLNSLYGKTAQSIGHGDKKPPFQSYLWAGMITSGTRAKILEAMHPYPRKILSIATDGIVSTEPLPHLSVTEKLGDWEYSQADSIFIAQSGVYQYTKNEKVYPKTRGFSLRELSFDKLEEAFKLQGYKASVFFDCIRFVGLGAALARTDYKKFWRKWIMLQKEMFFDMIPRRIPVESTSLSYQKWLAPIIQQKSQVSSPYKMKANWSDMFDGSLIERMEQPEFV